MKKENISKFETNVSSITPFTLLDFPNHIASILWFQGCNFRCKYCYNIDIVKSKYQSLKFATIKKFLISKKNFIEGIVFSGGECTLSKSLFPLVEYSKHLGYFTKVDTNGSNPDVLKFLLNKNLVDYIALDYKVPFTKYKFITNFSNTEQIKKSLNLLIDSKINFEIRTTIHSSIIDESDINCIIENLDKANYKGSYFIQNFKETKTLGGLSKQTKKFDLNKITKSNKFKVCFRNF